jgi:phosphohistidine phosphatase SixA
VSDLSTLNDIEVLKALVSGGCVLVVRHASAYRSAASSVKGDTASLLHERRLDSSGSRNAREMGAALFHLQIPIGAVFSSPQRRALETILLAGLPQSHPLPQLDEIRDTDSDAASTWLRTTVTQQPRPGTNTVIVTHLPNILGSLGDRVSDATPGEMLVFRPDSSAQPKLLSRIRPEHWPRLLGVTRLVRS